MERDTQSQTQPKRVSLTVQTQEENREGQLRLGLPGRKDREQPKLRSEGLLQGGGLQRGQGEGVPDQVDRDHEKHLQ